jgi:hypothetical protein
MFTQEFRDLLIQVITSWQVLVVTGVLIFYIFLVNYAARLYHHRRPAPSPGSGKKKKASGAGSPPVVSDDLGLEEEGSEDE